ncbi:hypothetical protein [Zhongshania marina]|uniref:Uncharacterized protein n=1 Tax=Zhongshania marina TaxID=2304603 RepID=A0A2S4HF68_9GAMM|nr:hypothetical protein [Marortus luteolus]POP52600.1 hypothetical protein C0068_11015 [Marortus luteolus]
MSEKEKSGSELLEALKYTTSDRLKSAQRKLTSARNTITGEALTHPYEAFFSENDKEVLRQAANILGQFKNKVEHAKEIRAREEREWNEYLKRCGILRQTILNKYLKSPRLISEHTESVVFHLALQRFRDSIERYRGTYFGHGIKWIEDDFNHGLDDKYPHMKVKHVAPKCHTESFDWLSENLWKYDEEPTADQVIEVMDLYHGEWREATLDSHEDFFQRYSKALLFEFEDEAAKEREIDAVRRRAGIKAVK